MIRVLLFLILVFALGLGFAWLADRPGDIVVTFAGYQYRATLMVAAVIVTAIVAAAMIVWWLIKSIWNSPHAFARYVRIRRRDRGYQALSTGMIAAGSGDAGLARKKKKEALKLLKANQEPLIHLLDAQAALLEGDHDGARTKFEAMLADPETRLLGLRGLYLEAERLGDRAAARHYAARAVETAPQLAWATEASLEKKTEQGEWDDALRLIETQKATHQLDRDLAHRRKAVLLTAKAMSLLDADPAGARNAAVEANRLAPDLVPAAVTAAKAYFRLDDLRRGAKLLETVWKKDAHPQVAEAYVHARHGDSTHDRLTRARKLRSIKQNHVESELALARAALDAGEFTLARESAQGAIRMSPREGAFLLMADIEEAETGDQGKVREWLSRAVRAPADPAWVADGYVSERWAPVSPVTGRLDAFEWRAPVERLGQLIEEEREPVELIAPAKEIAGPETIVPPAPEIGETPADDMPEPHGETMPAKPAEPGTVNGAAEPAIAPVPAETIGREAEAKEAVKTEPAGTETRDDPRQPTFVDASTDDAIDDENPPPPHLPDDPGVDPDDEKDHAQSRFRLF